MKAYLISYDLDKPGQDYSRLINRLEQYGAVRILYSEWVLKTTWTAVQLRNDLQTYIDSNDLLLVVGLSGEAAWTSLMISDERFKQILAA